MIIFLNDSVNSNILYKNISIPHNLLALAVHFKYSDCMYEFNIIFYLIMYSKKENMVMSGTKRDTLYNGFIRQVE